MITASDCSFTGKLNLRSPRGHLGHLSLEGQREQWTGERALSVIFRWCPLRWCDALFERVNSIKAHWKVFTCTESVTAHTIGASNQTDSDSVTIDLSATHTQIQWAAEMIIWKCFFNQYFSFITCIIGCAGPHKSTEDYGAGISCWLDLVEVTCRR